MEVIVMYSIGLIVISFIIAVTKSKLKGKAGEVTINHFLKKLDSNEYIIINDFILPNDGNTKTTQIDHAVISLYGIFSIETKNYKGQIYGNTYSKQWTQISMAKTFFYESHSSKLCTCKINLILFYGNMGMIIFLFIQ